jgi:hypothetical protein
MATHVISYQVTMAMTVQHVMLKVHVVMTQVVEIQFVVMSVAKVHTLMAGLATHVITV